MKTSAVYLPSGAMAAAEPSSGLASGTPDVAVGPTVLSGRPSLSQRVSSDPSGAARPSQTVPVMRTSRSIDGVGRSKIEMVEGNLQLVDVIEESREVMCIRYSPDAVVLAAGFADGSVRVYSADTGQRLYQLTTDDMTSTKLPVTSIRFLPTTEDEPVEQRHLLAASYASGEVRFWHYTSGTCLHTAVEQRSQTMAVAFNPFGDKFVTVGDDPKVFLYDVTTRKLINVMEATDSRDKMDGHRARVFSAVYHPDEPNVLLTGGWDDTVQFWDDRQRHAVRKFFGPHICGDALDIDPVHNHILTGSWRKDNPLQIWDYRTTEKIKDVPQDSHQSQLYCAQWLGRDSIVCGGCFSNMARVIDRGTLNTAGQLVQLPQGVYCLDNDRIGPKPRLAVGAACKIYLLRSALSSNK